MQYWSIGNGKTVLHLAIGGLLLVFAMVYPAPAGAAASGGEGPPGFDNLNLTGEQERALQELQNRFRQDMDQIRKRIMALRLELRTLDPEDLQGSKGQVIRNAIRELMVSGRERTLFYQQEAWSLLKEDQRVKLPPGSDLGFRCHLGGSMGRGPGREFRKGPGRSPAATEKPSSQP